MPFLSDVLGQAENQITNTIQGQSNSVKTAVGIVENNARNTLANTASNVVSNGIKATEGAAVNAFNAVASGNISGALSALNPANLASSALSGLGSLSSISLSEPGNVAPISGTGGITPGDPLNGALARADPLLNFLWYCQLPVVSFQAGSGPASPGVTNTGNSLSSFVSGLIGGALSSPLGGAISASNSAQLPWYYVEEATAPFRQFQPTTIFRDGRERHYPSKYTVGGLRLGIYADTENVGIQYLQAWNNAIIQPFTSSSLALGGGWGRPSGYKLPIYIYLLDVTKSVLAIIQYTECWPTAIQDYSLGSSSSERIVNHVDFSVGDVFINLMNVPPNLLTSIVNNVASNALNSVINTGANLVQSAAKSAANTISSFF